MPAAQATSINYIQVVFAALWGYLWFSEGLTSWVVIGGVMVLASTLVSLQARRPN